MKNTIHKIKNSWTFNHKTLIIALSLAVAHVWPLIPWPQTEAIEYTKPAATDKPLTLAEKAEQRAKELYKENEQFDLEKYRHEALKEMNKELLSLIDDSPYINYKDLAEKYPQP